MPTMLYTDHASPAGRLLIAGDGDSISIIDFCAKQNSTAPGTDWKQSADAFAEACRQLDAYFNRELTEFDLPLQPQGTAFQMQVWTALTRIAYGQTCSYADIARSIGRPKACRAVGAANNANPVSIVIPCHRVIGADGELVGYGGGLQRKKQLLELENAACMKRLYRPVQQSLFEQ